MLDITVHPVTADRWLHLEQLFGPKGACGGGWGMWWRQRGKDYARLRGEQNNGLLRHLVLSGQEPGLLAYADGQPVGWCALAPRSSYVRLEFTRIFKPVDNAPVWSVVCFYVAKGYRRQGVTHRLLEEAIAYAKAHGVCALEAYPIEPREGAASPDVYAYPGLASTYRALGFVEVARRSPTRPIMRYTCSA
jgi:GNAT superfamily N-acetyltransferase